MPLIEWQPGIKVKPDFVPLMDDLASELYYGPWDTSDSIEVRILPFTFRPSLPNSYRPSPNGKIAGLTEYGIAYGGRPLIALYLPPIVRTNYNLFTVAHEVGHVVTGGVTPEQISNPIKLTEFLPWRELKANDWAVQRFRKWGIRKTRDIAISISFDFLWMMEEARKDHKLMEAIRDHPQVKKCLEIEAKCRK